MTKIYIRFLNKLDTIKVLSKISLFFINTSTTMHSDCHLVRIDRIAMYKHEI